MRSISDLGHLEFPGQQLLQYIYSKGTFSALLFLCSQDQFLSFKYLFNYSFHVISYTCYCFIFLSSPYWSISHTFIVPSPLWAPYFVFHSWIIISFGYSGGGFFLVVVISAYSPNTKNTENESREWLIDRNRLPNQAETRVAAQALA